MACFYESSYLCGGSGTYGSSSGSWTYGSSSDLWTYGSSFASLNTNPGAVLDTRVVDDAVIIVSRIGPPDERKGFENLLLPAVKVGLEGWDRAHSQPAGLGVESPYGIYYAPAELNRSVQLRVENFLRDLYEHKRSTVDLILTTETRPHPGTLQLQSITYRVDAEEGGERWRLFEVTLEVENKRESPKITITEPYIFHDLETIL